MQDLRDDVRRLKEEWHARETVRELFAQVADVHAGGLAAHFLQLNEKCRVGAPDGAGVAVGEVDAAVRQADIVEDRGQLVLRDGFADDAVYLVGEARCFLNAQARASAHVQSDLSGVNLWKEIAAENSDEHDRETAKSQKAYGEEHWRSQSGAQGSSVAFPEFFKIPLKALMFSISTVASSTRMPTASARPPRVMILMVWPRALRQRMLTRIDKGIETAMIRVLFQFPRKSRIITAVRQAAMMPSRMTPWMEARP